MISGEETLDRKRKYYQKNKEKIKEYNQKTYQKNKVKRKIYSEKYYQENKERLKLRANNYRNNPNNEKRIKEGKKEYYEINNEKIKLRTKLYRGKLENKRRRMENHQKRMKKDKNYRVECSIRSHFNQTMKIYSKSGKVRSSKEHGISYKAIIEHLKPFPKDIENYHKDHIIPLRWFDFNNPKEIVWALSPENWQWLRKELNLWKSDKFILPLTIKEQDVLMKKMFPKSIKNN